MFPQLILTFPLDFDSIIQTGFPGQVKIAVGRLSSQDAIQMKMKQLTKSLEISIQCAHFMRLRFILTSFITFGS